jgi:RNA polymerase sigma-70 factor (ECF subfamily)
MDSSTDRNLPTDSDLLAQIAAGDVDAFHLFYRRHIGRVLSYTRRLARGEDLVEDIAQEVFVAVWRKAGTYRPERGDALGWLYTLTRNKLVDAWRRPERRAEHPAEPAVARAQTDPKSGDLRLALRQALSRLKPEQSRAIDLAYFGDLTYQETAAELAVPVGTLKSRIRVGLLAMRSMLEPLEPLLPGIDS